MPKTILPLTDKSISAAKPKDKPYKLYDGHGLYLIIRPQGGKWWRIDYSFQRKRKTLSLGTYPNVSLQQARLKRDRIKSDIANEIDPSSERKVIKLIQTVEEEKAINTFENLALAHLQRIEGNLSDSYYKKISRALERDIYPYLGKKPINDISRSELLNAIQKIEERGAVESAHRILNLCSQVFKYAVTIGKAPHNITADIDKRYALRPSKERNYPTITNPKKIGHLLRAIETYEGDPVTRYALQMMPYVFVRPHNIRHAEWSEFDLERKEWRIPAEKMKMKTTHIVPLTDTVIKILEKVKPLSLPSGLVFPSPHSSTRPLSENTLNVALRRLGYTKDEIVSHGFRAMFSTIAHERISEHGFHGDVIERQLAHSERNKVKAAYNHAEYLNERRGLMQWWSNFLDHTKSMS